MKKISFLTFARFPSETAHSVSIAKMCQSIKKLGYDLTLVADIRKKKEEVFEYYMINHPFDIKPIKRPDIRFLGRILFSIKSIFYLRKHQPDLIYVRDLFNAYLTAMRKQPFIYEAHEVPFNRFRKILMKHTLKSQRLKSLVIISSRLKTRVEDTIGNINQDSKCHLAHDGVDLTEFESRLTKAEARKILDLPEKEFFAGYTGSLFEGRGLEIILKLAVMLKDIVFVIVGGEGKYLEAFREKIKASALNNVLIKGFVPHRLIPSYLFAFDVLLMPYQKKVMHRQKKRETASYMSPLKMFEYMASGRPIIGSRLEAVEEVLIHRKNALLVKPEDAAEWAAAIKTLRDNKSLAEEIGNQARKDVEPYGWDERAKNIFSSF